MELSNMWKDAEEQQLEAQNDTPVLIGSIRLVVCVSGIKIQLLLPLTFDAVSVLKRLCRRSLKDELARERLVCLQGDQGFVR